MVDVHKINIVKKKKICHTRIYSVFIPRSLLIITLPVIFLCICMYRIETKFPSLMLYTYRASLVAQLVKNLSAMQETWVLSLDWEYPLEKGKGYPLQYSGLKLHGVAKS